MARVALLIGTETYGSGFKPLPAAPKDVSAWEEVLRDSEMGGFDDVQKLVNPSQSEMAQTIETWFRSHTKEDLAVLFISGHGVKDDQLNLYFASKDSRKEKEILVRSTAVAASFVRDCIRDSKSKRQVVILDCCFSGAFGDLLAKDDGLVDLKSVLGAEGRVVLTSSSSIQYSFEQQDSSLSIYSRYLTEGIRTGAADLDDDGAITVDELHEFASRKVQEESPAMNPQIIVLKNEGYRIRLANAPLGDPKVKYRKEVETIVLENEGEIDEVIDRAYLDELCESLKISKEVAAEIEFQVLEPIRQRNAKIVRYQDVFTQAVGRRYPPDDKDRRKLQRLQKVLGLRDEDVSAIELPIVEVMKSFAASSKATVHKIKSIATGSSTPVSEKETQPSNPIEQPLEDDLSSEKGMDYKPLRDMLKAGKWQEADQETLRVMLEVMGRQNEGWLRVEDVQQFPCLDLRTIDQLWVKYSNGKFGFSVQKQIWQECGSPKSYNDDWTKFGDRVGWRVNQKWINYPSGVTFDTSASKGHLPSLGSGVPSLGSGVGGWRLEGGVVRWCGAVFFSRAETCEL